ncbi:MAG TPA: DUF4124 domain-containing protein [Solimonas sp.]|nr:DUF4124 domain-containing protein [Solimonas sp.]
MDQRRPLAVALLLGLSLSAVAGPVYKYVDPQGRVHYADRAQPGWTAVDVRPPPTSSPPPETPADPAGENGEPGATPPAADASATPARDPQACKNQREQLETYKAAAKITEKDGLGREREYTAQERDMLIRQTEQQVKASCGS